MKRLLATRQPEDNAQITRVLQKQGWKVFNWPALVIEPLNLSMEKPSNKIETRIDIVIFNSKNTVRKDIINLLDLEQKKVVCVGGSTSEKLRHLTGITAITPKKTTTEGLLELPVLNTRDKKIIIVKGKGGRKKLKQVLIKRKNKVKTISVYKRKINIMSKAIAVKINEFHPGYLLATSIKSLDSIKFQVDGGLLSKKIIQSKLICFSERIKNEANKMGFKNTIIVKKMSNNGIIETLVEIL